METLSVPFVDKLMHSNDIQTQLKDRLRFVFRNFPLTQIHPHAQKAAEAAEAAGVQKKFWDIYDILYENQQALDYYHLIEYASIVGLNVERFNNDLFSMFMPAVYMKTLLAVFVAV
jgi:hypothetical protein